MDILKPLSTDRDLPQLPKIPPGGNLTIGVLALQGAFREHLNHLRRLQTLKPLSAIAVRTISDLHRCHALIIPGGESTSMALIASRQRDSSDFSLMDWIKSFCKERAVWGTCAGMILLSDELVSQGTKSGGQDFLGGLPIRTTRNQWGRQTESFEYSIEIPCLKNPSQPFPAIFIRAPVIHTILDKQLKTSVVASLPPISLPSTMDLGPDAHVVAIRSNNLFATSFHPELSSDNRLHQFWLDEFVLKPYQSA
ncbi:hypothetical protein O181_028394 [Austropuccinia psidii MF-1]|uniref:glutaminase n=1 Tax=Austropuccinia psidii MF-1 TaxID=1389203 RepID=A0A9Q3H3J4_9BASI|nr:hypothetical protein [Austropuccinia psidii MF-1]